ncbi:PIN domain-containing protein [Methylobacterium sp. J-026]|uniref:PIN domain-containing protein n=1 Tax=Methylobacterium sp. J-026 TaxID=2836624 RepID=UPI001FB9F2EA|nr:PIN domain-containing protein [Methylobacterium sp. J-026]MCJ2138347.1 PIN domain-containing protein [Methylobacterium sp. J-026]
MTAGAGSAAGGREPRRAVLRVCLDVNVWIAYLLALQQGRVGTVPMRLVAMVQAGAAGTIPLQLMVSQEMLGTLEHVLKRLGLPDHLAEGFPQAIDGLMRVGPETLDPALLTAGRDQLAMRDREDAGVLAFCMVDRVDLLVTDNLADFLTKDSERRETQLVTRTNGITRQLFVLLHERVDGVSLAVAHPIDAVAWLAADFWPDLASLRQRYP